MAHALMSPSAAKRWIACPGSVLRSAGKSTPDSIYSAEGTFLHGIAARVLTEGRASAHELVGTTGTEAGFVFTLTAEHADLLQHYLDAVRRPVMLGGDLQVERKVYISSRCHGTADAIVWEEGRRRLHVFDLKMGQGVFISAEGNEQMLTYACGALAEAGTPPHLIDGATLHIVQPRCPDADGRVHREWEVTPDELAEHSRKVAQVEVAVIRAENGGGIDSLPLSPGDHCRWCPGKDGCPALAASALAAARDLFPDTDDLTVAPAPVAPPLLSSLSNERLAALLETIGHADEWFRTVRAEAYARAMRGAALPGYKLVRSQGNRRWVSDVETARVLQGLGIEPWAPRVLASPAQVEKKHPEAKRIVGTLVERPFGEPKLVPESDKRPAFTPDPTADFTALPALDESNGQE